MPADHTEKIDQYLFNAMSDSEKKAFETEVNQNNDLAKELSIQKEMIELIELIDTKNKIEAVNYEQKKPEEKPEKNFRIHPIYYLAAASFLVFMGSFLVLNKLSNNGFKNIANQNYQAYLLSDERSTNPAEAIGTKDKAIQLYQQAKYKEAIPHLKQIAEDESVHQLILGISYFEINDYTAALQHFKSLIDDEDLLYINEAHWYAAITQLQMNEPEDASENLMRILNDENASKKIQLQAENLLAEIKLHY